MLENAADPLFIPTGETWTASSLFAAPSASICVQPYLASRRNLLTLLICAPIHGMCALLCARDARFFDLVLLWGRTRLPAVLGTLPLWKASSYSIVLKTILGS